MITDIEIANLIFPDVDSSLDKLEERVKAKGLEWYKLEEMDE